MAVLWSLFAALLDVLGIVLYFYTWVLFVHVALSWLIAFEILNTRNRAVHVIGDVVYRMTEPVLSRIRRFLPVVGGIDLSPFVLILAIYFLQSFLSHLVRGL